jgi:hypothetical protein
MIATQQLVLLAADNGGGGILAGVGGCVCGLIYLAVVIIAIAGMWKVFAKAGEPGVAAIVPIWNMMTLAKVSGREPIVGLMCLIPCVGFIFPIIWCMDVAKRFGKDAMYGLGLAFLGFIFFPLLGFGSAQFIGNRGNRPRGRDDY